MTKIDWLKGGEGRLELLKMDILQRMLLFKRLFLLEADGLQVPLQYPLHSSRCVVRSGWLVFICQ